MNWDELPKIVQLQNTWSDYHKDFYGFRPKDVSAEQWNSEKFLQEQIDIIDRSFARMKSTFEGREQLRADGWLIEEKD